MNLSIRPILAYRSEAVGADWTIAESFFAEPGDRLPIIPYRLSAREASVVRVWKIVIAYLHNQGRQHAHKGEYEAS
jgi:hypothetical protein